MKKKIKAKEMKRKMDPEEVQAYLKLKSGNGTHHNKKAYNRNHFKKIRAGRYHS